MVHGNPTWSFLYRNIAKSMIAKGYRVIAADHLGMGMSDAPDLANFDYKPRSHSANLEALINALDLKKATIVVQDWGGPVGLGVAGRQPDRFSRMLIMNTWAWSVNPVSPGLDHSLVAWGQQAKTLNQGDPQFGCNTMLALTAETIAESADPSKGALYKTIREAYLNPGINPSTMKPISEQRCAAMSNFALSILDDNKYQSEVESNLKKLQAKPYIVLSGLKDQLFGALRCDQNATPACPISSACVCEPDYAVAGACNTPQTPLVRFDFVCKSNGALIEHNTDQWEQRLGRQSLVARVAVPNAEHMIQEFASAEVIAALDKLLSTPAP
jgi:pimeloyl-ACP methyl ester carboxylesterase